MSDPSLKKERPRKQESYLPETLRSLPQSIDAEKGVLGSILLLPQTVLDECIKRQVSPKYFHLPAHALIFSTLVEMHEAKRPIDLISLTQFLEDAHKLDEVGGAAAVTDLFTFVPTAANASYYLEIVREKYLLRQIISTCTEYAARAYSEQNEVPILLDEVEKKVLAIGRDRFAGVTKSMKSLALGALESVEKLFESRGALTGLASGFRDLDEITNGLQPSEMIVIAARPSMGKTALAMNIVEHVAVAEGKCVAVYSLEMSAEKLALRMLCSMARVELKKIRNGFMNKAEMNSLVQATTKISKSKLFIDDTSSLDVMEFQAIARRLHHENTLDLIVVDYLQLMRSPSRRGQDNRQVEVAEISGGIKALAKELQIPIIVLAQLNRNPDARVGATKGKPNLSDLRESGAIEQDADLVALLWRESRYLDDDEKKEVETEADLIIAKHRNGEVGTIPLTFHAPITRFEDRASEGRTPSE